MSVLRAAALFLMVLPAACNAWQDRSEFAPPESRWSSTQPSPAGHNDPPPPVARQYCYRTLAQVDCYSEPKPDRVTGYSGVYPDPASQTPPKPAH